MSLADGLATALLRYKAAKDENGLEALLLGRVTPADPQGGATGAATVKTATKKAPTEGRRGSNGAGGPGMYKIKCPQCAGSVSFEEGCVKCYSCGFSQC